MKIEYDPDFVRKLKKVDVRIKKRFEKRLSNFLKNPFDPELNNHVLRKPYGGLRSIDITADYRAIYEEFIDEEESIVHFVAIGTHEELYGS
jgi:addiction module RelE/StbE family toxin